MIFGRQSSEQRTPPVERGSTDQTLPNNATKSAPPQHTQRHDTRRPFFPCLVSTKTRCRPVCLTRNRRESVGQKQKKKKKDDREAAMLVARRTACLKATAGRGIPISTQHVCCSYYYRGHAGGLDRPRCAASMASPIASAVRPVVDLANLAPGTAAGDAPRACMSVVGQARNKSTAALMEETDDDVGRGVIVDRGAGDGGSLTSFRLTGERR